MNTTITESSLTPPAADRSDREPGEATDGAADTFTVIAWRDPLVDQAAGAIATDSDEALVWYTPSVGTIGMAMAHRFARHASHGPSTWTIDDIGRTFGISPSPGRVLRSVERLERFGIVRRHGRTLAVRLWLAPLTDRQRGQLPGYLAAAYDAR